MSQDIPQWALAQACEHLNAELKHNGSPLRYRMSEAAYNVPIIVLARYIAAHEEPPVDPLLLEAREIVARFYDTKEGSRHRAKLFRDGDYDNEPECAQALTALRRGMELAKQEPNP